MLNLDVFFPDDFEVQKSPSAYMKLQPGENKLRILSQPLVGYEEWIENKPVRYRKDPGKSHDANRPVKQFAAFVVWNYKEERIQILQITQKLILLKLKALSDDKDWGAPYFYDLKIIKTGKDKLTKYDVNPLPHKPVSEEIRRKFKETPISLDALFSNTDPFSKEYDHYAAFAADQAPIISDAAKVQPKRSEEEIQILKAIITQCDMEYRRKLEETLFKTYNITRIEDIPSDIYDRVKLAAIKKKDEYTEKLSKQDLFAEGS